MHLPSDQHEEASYIIFKKDGDVFARNGDSGNIEFSGTDAAMVIQDALDAIETVGGGKCHIKPGTYTLDSKALYIPSDTVLEGEGGNTIITIPDSWTYDDDNVRGGSADYIMMRNKNWGDAINDYNIIVRNLRIDGNGPNQTNDYIGVAFASCDNVIVENAPIENTAGYNIGSYVIGGVVPRNLHIVKNKLTRPDTVPFHDSVAVNAHNLFCRGNFIDNDNGAGFTGARWENAKIVDNQVSTNDLCINIDHTTVRNNVHIIGNLLNSSGSDSILAKLVSRLVIADNLILPNARGMHFNEDVDNLVIMGNYLYGGSHGISFTGGESGAEQTYEKVVIQGNVLDTFDYVGIEADTYNPISEALIVGNRMENLNTTDTAGWGAIRAELVNCMIQGNQIINNNQNGINSVGDAAGNYCIDNDLRGNPTAISSPADFARTKGNVGYNTFSEVADGMTANPEADPEDGFIEVEIGGTTYQIPIYAA